MIISILNCDKKFGIGKKNSLLFSLPKDMEFFKKTTLNHTVAMGENTLLSLPGCKPLKNRTNIVLCPKEHIYEGCICLHTFKEFVSYIKKISKKEDVYIIGGASIYNQMMPYVNKILLTKVDEDGGAEVFFPNIDEDKNFECIEESPFIDDNGHKIKFTTYKRLK